MNRAELVAAVALETGLDPGTVDHAINGLTHQVITAMASGGSVTIRNFGKFSARKRAGMHRVHPATGEPIEVPPQMTVTFTASTAMKERMNR